MSRRGLTALGVCLVGALTVALVGEGSAIPASAAGSATHNLVVNGNFAAPSVSAAEGAIQLGPGSQTGS